MSAVGLLAGCGGRGLIDSNQVVVRVEDYGNVAGATTVAQDTCARRGGRARLILVSPGRSGNQQSAEPRWTDAVFTCDPVR